MKMEAEYKGFVIKWDEWDNGFVVYDGQKEVRGSNPSLESCEKWIDQKTKVKYNRVAVLAAPGYGSKIVPCEATSLVNDDTVWVSSGSERSHASIKNVYLDTPENRADLERISAFRKEIEVAQKDIADTFKSMEVLTKEMMVKE